MKIGKRQKTTVQRELDGSRTRPHHHPQPVVETTCEPPAKMPKAVAAYWRYFAPILAEARMTTAADRESLRMYCVALTNIDSVLAQQADPAYCRVMLTVTIDGAGNERVKAETNPLDVQLRNWLEVARHHGAELGLSPASRTRVTPTAAKPQEQQSNLARLQSITPFKRPA